MSLRTFKSDDRRGDRPEPRSGVISLHEVYRIDEAKRRLGWSDSAYRAARRRGLNALVSGKRSYLTGAEILRFLQADGSTCRG